MPSTAHSAPAIPCRCSLFPPAFVGRCRPTQCRHAPCDIAMLGHGSSPKLRRAGGLAAGHSAGRARLSALGRPAPPDDLAPPARRSAPSVRGLRRTLGGESTRQIRPRTVVLAAENRTPKTGAARPALARCPHKDAGRPRIMGKTGWPRCALRDSSRRTAPAEHRTARRADASLHKALLAGTRLTPCSHRELFRGLCSRILHLPSRPRPAGRRSCSPKPSASGMYFCSASLVQARAPYCSI